MHAAAKPTDLADSPGDEPLADANAREVLRVWTAEYTALRAEQLNHAVALRTQHHLSWLLLLLVLVAYAAAAAIPAGIMAPVLLVGMPLLGLLQLYRCVRESEQIRLISGFLRNELRPSLLGHLRGVLPSGTIRGLPAWESHRRRRKSAAPLTWAIIEFAPWASYGAVFVVSFGLGGALLGGLTGGVGRMLYWAIGGVLCLLGLVLTVLTARLERCVDGPLEPVADEAVPEQNQYRFAAKSLETAKAIILTPEEGVSTEERWVRECEGMRRLLLPRIPPQAVVLDFGTGIGRNLKTLADERSDIRLIGVDASPDMRRLAPQYVGHGGRLTIHEGLSAVPDASVDLAISTYVLQHVSGHVLPGVIQHLHRVLKPGGKLFVIDCHHRVVPEMTALERTTILDGAAVIDETVRRVAMSSHGADAAWISDGLSVQKLLRQQFGCEGERIEPDPAYFGAQTRRETVFAFFEKRR